MFQQMLDLYEVQKIDLEIRDVQRQLDEIPKDLRRMEGEVTELKSEGDKTRLERDGLIREIRDHETNLTQENVKLKKWEARLADIRNQREYLALSREIEGGKRQNREIEERVQALSTRRTELDKKIDETAGKVTSSEGDVSSEREKADGASSGVREKLQADTTRRQELVVKIPKPLLSKYESIRAKRVGVGIVPVVGGLCKGCNMRIPPQLFNILQRGQTVEQCPSCQRIIFSDSFLTKQADAAASAS